MKTPRYTLTIALLLLTSCAQNTLKPAADNQHVGMKHQHDIVKQGLCAAANPPPLSQCSATVTATFDPAGNLWIAWVNHESLYVQKSVDKGMSFSAPVLVNAKPEAIAAKDESRPKIKVNAQGNVYLSWVQTLDKKRSTYVRFSRSTDGGQHFSEPVTINDNLDIIRHRFDSLALGQHGEVLIAWLDARHTEAAKKAGEEFAGLSLYYTWSADAGQHFYPNQKIADHTCECCRIETAVNQQNQPVIAWRHIFAGGIRDHALVSFSNWQTPGSPKNLGEEHWQIDACPHHGPGFAVAADGNYHAVWFSNAQTQKGLFYAHSVDNGNHFSTPLPFGGPGATHPHVATLGQRVAIVWQSYDGQHNNIQFIQSKDGGSTWTAAKVVANATGYGDEPFLIADQQQLYLSWQVPQAGYQLLKMAD